MSKPRYVFEIENNHVFVRTDRGKRARITSVYENAVGDPDRQRYSREFLHILCDTYNEKQKQPRIHGDAERRLDIATQLMVANTEHMGLSPEAAITVPQSDRIIHCMAVADLLIELSEKPA